MATHKVQQLDINLGRVKDEGAREALQSVVRFVNEMTQSIRTNKEVRASELANSEKSAGLDKSGFLWAESLEIASGGQFKVKTFNGEIEASGTLEIAFSSGTRILGAFGYTQYAGSSNWIPITAYDSASARIDFAAYAVGTIRLANTDTVNDHKFNLVVFYADR